jgi:uroporphyrinogen-III synthase
MSVPSFAGRRVLLLESRRSRELAALVTTYGGEPIEAPSMREVPLESNQAAVTFAAALERGEFDLVVLLTGVGTRALVDLVEQAQGSRQPFVAALGRTKVLARGPKPVAVLRDLGLTPWVTAPEPNTWREVLNALDAHASALPLAERHVAVQEYGEPSAELLAGLEQRGARVTRVPVYKWALPEDLEPLRHAVRVLAAGEVDVVLLTTATQVVHLLQVAGSMTLKEAVLRGLGRAIVASVGPTTSEELRQQGITVDFEPSRPKMGFLVREAAEQVERLLAAKRGASDRPV